MSTIFENFPPNCVFDSGGTNDDGAGGDGQTFPYALYPFRVRKLEDDKHSFEDDKSQRDRGDSRSSAVHPPERPHRIWLQITDKVATSEKKAHLVSTKTMDVPKKSAFIMSVSYNLPHLVDLRSLSCRLASPLCFGVANTNFTRPNAPSGKEHPRRLINARTLRLADFESNVPVPQYAILSHRWGAEEIGHQEFSSPTAETKLKSGYRKILDACKQALLDGLEYIWIDTCCINQEDRGDVHRNIRSMFAFYQHSSVCYAHLNDVAASRESSRLFGLMTSFKDSRWFSRGWTLQELLAPPEVVFYNDAWHYIGTRSELTSAISKTTGIPANVINGYINIEDVDIHERMSWSALRKTTRPPDQAYCLFGILGVTIEPNYDEDVETAFARLWEACSKKYPDKVGDSRFRGHFQLQPGQLASEIPGSAAPDNLRSASADSN
ncbi:hypothetical protein VKT23_002827 [Stygiomarasmius scandens]|uniref:Heterokaryon incompatibility domain-containing protein n=1 Tax=Marasmiellus scandens TaxID=2682957 RepID=A0ABR1JWU6_9AGAR